MTDNTQPEALRLADALEYCDASVARQAINELRSQHARIAELEAQLEAIGAGGVSGPLMGRASLAASAGSEPVIGWHAFPHYLQHPDGRLLRTASDLLARHGYTGCAEPLRAMSDVLLSTNPSPPEGAGWRPIDTAPKDEMYRDGPNAYAEYILVWYPGAIAPIRARWWQSDSGRCNFLADGSYAVFPTVWMPLPAPPLPASEAKEL